MILAGMESTDIKIGEDGQPETSSEGDFTLVSDVPCWLQDIRNEALTQEGELFYEEDAGAEAYGFSMHDFTQSERDGFTEMEIEQRIREKLRKREGVDEGTLRTEVSFDGRNYHIKASFKINGSNEECNLEMETDGVEVVLSD